MKTIYLITPLNIKLAARKNDINDALYPLQVIANIKYGDFAGCYFSGIGDGFWERMSFREREELIVGYLDAELTVED